MYLGKHLVGSVDNLIEHYSEDVSLQAYASVTPQLQGKGKGVLCF